MQPAFLPGGDEIPGLRMESGEWGVHSGSLHCQGEQSCPNSDLSGIKGRAEEGYSLSLQI